MGKKPELTKARRVGLICEAIVVYGSAPLIIYFGLVSIGCLLPMLGIWAVASLLILRRDPEFDNARLWNFSGFTARRKVVMNLFAVGVILIFAFELLLLHAKDRGWFAVPVQVDWFALPRHKPLLYIFVMIAYPLLSVYPQEVIYRGLFYQRYAPAFGSTKVAIVVNALFFGWGHIIFRNPVAIGLTLIGGAIFSLTYIRSRSLLASSIEHSLYGCLLFTIGLGWYFIGGSVAAVERTIKQVVPVEMVDKPMPGEPST